MTAVLRIERPAAILLVAVVFAGTAAAVQVSPLLWAITAIVAWIILRGALRDTALASSSDVDIREFPPALRNRVRSTSAQLPSGDARRLLLGVVNQARLVFGRDESRFDATEEARLRDHVAGLVDACCPTAADLARLDQFAANAGTARADLAARAARARELFRDRLTNAAAAIAELYTSNVERGTPSTDRVADLTAEISADASARSAASREIRELLQERD